MEGTGSFCREHVGSDCIAIDAASTFLIPTTIIY